MQKRNYLVDTQRGRLFEMEERAGWDHVPKEFVSHETQTEWLTKKGRIDIRIDEQDGVVTIVELKATDWDRQKPERLRPNALRHARQVWRYINDYVENRGKVVFAGIVYENEPRSEAVRLAVEEIVNAKFIQVAWRKGPIL